MERWKEHPVFIGYEGSNLGRIRSWRSTGGSRRDTPIVIKQRMTGLYPYFSVEVRDMERKSHTVLVHRFIAEVFIPNPENKLQVNHKNGVKTDNTPDNLEWVSCGENHRHSYKANLRDKKGEAHHFAKLTDADVINIRKRYAQGGITQWQLADEYGLGRVAITNVISGKNWSHLPGGDPTNHVAGRICPSRRVLSESEVSEIRKLLKKKEAQRTIAEKYGVSQTMIHYINIGKGRFKKERARCLEA